MAKKILVIGDYMKSGSPPKPDGLRKQSMWGGERWEPGMVPTGVLRTKVRYDADNPMKMDASVEDPVARTGKRDRS